MHAEIMDVVIVMITSTDPCRCHSIRIENEMFSYLRRRYFNEQKHLLESIIIHGLCQINTCLIHVAFDVFETDSAEFNA